MELDYLDTESENLLKEMLDHGKRGQEVSGAAMEYLVKSRYVEGLNSRTCEDKEPKYILTEITQKGKTYFERKTRYEKEQKRKSLRELIYLFVGAILGAILGVVTPKICNIIWTIISVYFTGK